MSADQMSPGQQVEFALTAGNIGKNAQATANAQGQATGVFDFANAPKPEVEVDVYTFTCPTPPTPARVVVKMVPHGDPPPDDPCGNRRMVGAFWLNKTRAITIHLADGTMDVNTGSQILKWGLIAGGAVAVIGIIAATAGGDSSTSNGNPPGTTTTTSGTATTTTTTSGTPTTTTTTTSTTTTTTTTSSQIPFTALNGTYSKSATRTSNNCEFFVASFSGTMTISGVDANGQGGTLTERHPSQTFVYSVTLLRSTSGFTFLTNTINSNIGGQTFSSNIFGTFSSANSGSGTEQFTRESPSCFDRFTETYTRIGS